MSRFISIGLLVAAAVVLTLAVALADDGSPTPTPEPTIPPGPEWTVEDFLEHYPCSVDPGVELNQPFCIWQATMQHGWWLGAEAYLEAVATPTPAPAPTPVPTATPTPELAGPFLAPTISPTEAAPCPCACP